MFELVRFNENPASHEVDVKVKYEWKKNTVEEYNKIFVDGENAKRWVNEHRLRYGHAKLKAYVDHKKILSEQSLQWSTAEDKMTKLASLDICIRETDAVKDYPLRNLAMVIELLYPHLVSILPLPIHLTYKSSKVVLNDLWWFAQEVISPRTK